MKILWPVCLLILFCACAVRKPLDSSLQGRPQSVNEGDVITGSLGWTNWLKSLEDIVPCADDEEYYSFTLKRPDAAQIKIIKESSSFKNLGFIGEFDIEPNDLQQDQAVGSLIPDLINYAMRFDFCVSSDAAFLKNIILRKLGQYSFGGLQPIFLILQPNEKVSNQSLYNAIYSGDFSALTMQFVPENDYLNSYQVRGFNLEENGKINSYLVINPFKDPLNPNKVPDSEKEESENIRVAPLSVGTVDPSMNPFVEFENPAILPKHIFTHTYRKNGFDFRFVYEATFSGGGYYSRDYANIGELSFVDPLLNLNVKLLKEEISAKTEHIYTHHNLNDSIIYKDADGRATYTLEMGHEGRNPSLLVDYSDEKIKDRKISLESTESTP